MPFNMNLQSFEYIYNIYYEFCLIFQEFDAVDFPKKQNCSLECGPNKNCLVDTCCAPKSKQELARRSSKENSPTRSSSNHNKLKTSASSPCFDQYDFYLNCINVSGP